jgi:hypothetical protein
LAAFNSAWAQSPAYFSGHVMDSQGNPIAGATIQAGFVGLVFAGWSYVVDGQATTNAQGDYAITTLDSANTSGQYVLVSQTPGYVLTVNPNLYCTDTSCLETASLPTTAPYTVAYSLCCTRHRSPAQ